MQSFLIIAKDKDKASAHISSFLKKEKINPFDINLQVFEKAMGIPDVRNIQKSISLKPFKGKIKAVIVQAYEGITVEAQNALLKVLEEPPANTIILITIQKKELILPTIISRCKIIILQEKEITSTQDSLSEFEKVLSILLNGKVGDKLKIAQDIARDKENATSWLEKMAVFVRKKLIENYNDPKYLNFLKELQKTYKVIKSTNVSQRTSLENLFLSF